jgi:hypothetical protein
VATVQVASQGIVRHPEIREVRRSDFCGHYIGESGPKTNEPIEKSLGRIIFMAEFYSLIERHEDGTVTARPPPRW